MLYEPHETLSALAQVRQYTLSFFRIKSIHSFVDSLRLIHLKHRKFD
jgi:hypothetical protein